jgi:hypothetical protein
MIKKTVCLSIFFFKFLLPRSAFAQVTLFEDDFDLQQGLV